MHGNMNMNVKCTVLLPMGVNPIAVNRYIIYADVSHVVSFLQVHKIYRMSQEEWTKLRESVPYVKIYRNNPKHLYPKLNGYGDKGQRIVWSFYVSTYCTWFA